MLNEKIRSVCETRMPPKTLTFADDLDLGTRRCILMRHAFIPNMSLVSKLI